MRLLGSTLFLFAPINALALQVPFVGSPFSHMTVHSFDKVSIPASTQGAQAAASRGTHTCKNDVCCSVTIVERNGVPVEEYLLHPSCEEVRTKVMKSTDDKQNCKNGYFRHVAGRYAWTDTSGTAHSSNRCDPKPPDFPGIGGGIVPNPVSNSTITADSLKGLDVQSTTDQAKMVDMFKSICVEGTCVPEDAAQMIVQSDPQKAYDLLSAMSSGDETKAVELAQNFQLDQQVIDENMGEIESIDTGEEKISSGAERNVRTSPCGYGGSWSDGLANAESGCGSNPDTFKNCGTGKGACGELQFQDTTYKGYLDEYQKGTGDTSCAGTTARDTACAVKITDYHYDQWLETSNGRACVESLQSKAACVRGQHWFGAGGLNDALKLYNQDPNQPAKGICQTSAYQSCGKGNMSLDGLSISDMFKKLDGQMGGSGGTPVYRIPGPNQDIQTRSVGGGALLKDTQPQVVRVADNSGNSGWGSSGFSLPLGMNLGSSLMSPFQNLFQPTYKPPTQTQQSPPLPAPTLALTVQPQVVVRGNPISVSWTSSGMSGSAPCTVSSNGAPFGTGNTGAMSTSTNASSTPTIVFRLLCQAATNGQVLQQSTSVLLQ